MSDERRPDGTHWSPSVGSYGEQLGAGVGPDDGYLTAAFKVQNYRTWTQPAVTNVPSDALQTRKVDE